MNMVGIVESINESAKIDFNNVKKVCLDFFEGIGDNDRKNFIKELVMCIATSDNTRPTSTAIEQGLKMALQNM